MIKPDNDDNKYKKKEYVYLVMMLMYPLSYLLPYLAYSDNGTWNAFCVLIGMHTIPFVFMGLGRWIGFFTNSFDTDYFFYD